MEKVHWEKPEMNEVAFAANEYVAACEGEWTKDQCLGSGFAWGIGAFGSNLAGLTYGKFQGNLWKFKDSLLGDNYNANLTGSALEEDDFHVSNQAGSHVCNDTVIDNQSFSTQDSYIYISYDQRVAMYHKYQNDTSLWDQQLDAEFWTQTAKGGDNKTHYYTLAFIQNHS